VNTTEREPHVCNVYCSGGVHATLAFSNMPGGPQVANDMALEFGPAARFLGVREDPEAPIPDWGRRLGYVYAYLLFIEVPS
jgi:hypothetical protein